MDDIIIFSTSLQEHIESLEKVFHRLEKANLKVQLDKSEFLHREVAFLGHIVTPQGVKPNPDKIKAIKKYPIPTTEKQIKSFLGLLGYYRKFIKNFAALTKPMTKCLRKTEVININDPEYIQSFEKAKEILSNEPLLQYPDFSQKFILTTDASNTAIGAVLSQGIIGKDLPICYASRTLTVTEQNYSTIEKELLAIVWATKYFRPYLFGRKFMIITDHKPLTWLFSLKEPNSKLVRWRLKLEEFDYEITYKKGTLNANADALSRIEIHLSDSSSSSEDTANILSTPDNLIPETRNSINTFSKQFVLHVSDKVNHPSVERKILFEDKLRITLTLPTIKNNIKRIEEVLQELFGRKRQLTCIFTTDEIFKEVLKIYYHLINHKPRKTNPKVNLVRSKIFLVDIIDPEEQKRKIKETHEMNEHRGTSENYAQIKTQFYFPYLKEKLLQYVAKCDTCLKIKYDRNPPNIELTVTETPKRPLEIIHTDIFMLNNVTFLTIIDKFTKHGTAYHLIEKTGKSIKEAIKTYIGTHGIPTKIVADNELCVPKTVQELTQKYNIILHPTTPYNSTGNSPVERFHSTLKELCSIIQLLNPEEEIKSIMQSAIIAYNNSIHSSTGMTPFQLLNGHYYKDTPEFGTELEYAQEHRNTFEQIYANLHEKTQDRKEKLIGKLNKNKEKAFDVPINTVVYVKKCRRSKMKPQYRKEKVIENIKNTPLLLTNTGKVHKNKIKNLFQVHANLEPGIRNNTTTEQQGPNPSAPGTSSPT